MSVHLCGVPVRHFDDLKDGACFWFSGQDGAQLAVKASRSSTTGAVTLSPDPKICASFLASNVFTGPVLGLPEVRLVPSVFRDDLTFDPDDYTPGSVYIFKAEATIVRALAFRHGETALVDLDSGAIVRTGRAPPAPIEIKRWALAVEVWGKPVTLFTYPAGSPELELG